MSTKAILHTRRLPQHLKGKRAREIMGKTIGYAVILALGFFFTLPFFFQVSTSLKTDQQTFSFPIQWIPDPVMWRNYIRAWVDFVPFNRYLRNTLYMTSTCLVGTLLSSSVVAYSFARLRWRGRDFLFIVLLSTMMLPYQVFMIPQFILFKYLGWINSFNPMIVPSFLGVGLGGTFFIFLLRQFFMTIPLELDDAAKIDGCSTAGILWRIILPLSKPALATVVIFSFLQRWNDFLLPLIFLNDINKYVLALGLMQFRLSGYVYWNSLMAASLIIMFPCILVFFLCQRYFIEGIALTGIKS